MENYLLGEIDVYFEDKGYGFVKDKKTGTNYFFHISNFDELQQKYLSHYNNYDVYFTWKTTKKGNAVDQIFLKFLLDKKELIKKYENVINLDIFKKDTDTFLPLIEGKTFEEKNIVIDLFNEFSDDLIRFYSEQLKTISTFIFVYKEKIKNKKLTHRYFNCKCQYKNEQ